MTRRLPLVLAVLLVWSVILSSPGYVLACGMTAPASAACPMREADKPAPPPAETHACCASSAEELRAAPAHAVSGACCCDISAADTDAPAAVLASVELPAASLPFGATLPVQPADFALPSVKPQEDSDAPRGPPRAALSPRAPPVYS